ncbi:Tyrosine-protein phosphatase non-receptor type 9 [Aphelenchoides besseyi]|nr:Tyrosine-protein phosphatase non-receptor type 9 [Aphelenchoides besseyi]
MRRYLNQNREEEEETADANAETTVANENQPTIYKNDSMNGPSDIRVTFIDDYCKRGVQVVMREFTQIRSYLPKNLKVEHFNRHPGRNRYADVMCLDENRVVLRDRSLKNSYIHASYVRVPENPKAQQYICTQGPMEETAEDFWQMIIQENVSVIVMLCNFYENGEEKCCHYYPRTKNKEIKFGFLCTVRNIKTGKTGIDTSTWSELDVETNFASSRVYHILWTDWIDHSAPSDALPVIQLLKLAKSKAGDGPIVVHCSAGIGRTGTFVGVDYISEKLRHSLVSTVYMQDLVKEFRRQRLHAIQSASQYVFLHVALIELAVSEKLVELKPLHRSFQSNYGNYLRKLRRKECARLVVEVPTPLTTPARTPAENKK